MKIDVKNKKILVRVDFNVPLDKEYTIGDDTRMRAALPTIKHLLENNAAIILMSHLGRPLKKKLENGQINVEKFTLRHLVNHLSELLNLDIKFAVDCVGPDAKEKAGNLKGGEVLLLENTRFHEEEGKGDTAFAQKLADLADVYVNDAFGTAHRAHASTTTVAQFFGPDKKSFGFLLSKEIENASKVLNNPDRPLTAILGGAKVSDKILLIDRLLDLANTIIIGGGMAYTFFKAQGGKVGNSLVEEDKLDLALTLIEKAKEKGVNLILPEDSIIADAFSETAKVQNSDNMEIPDGWMGLDIGPNSREVIRRHVLTSKTILWNGPMGVFEMAPFSFGTKYIAESVAEATKLGAFSLIGGGDSVSAINQLGLNDQVSYVSTGGGAMLEFLEGKELPGVKAIKS